MTSSLVWEIEELVYIVRLRKINLLRIMRLINSVCFVVTYVILMDVLCDLRSNVD